MLVEPADEIVFAIIDFERALRAAGFAGVSGHAVASALNPVGVVGGFLVGKTEIAEAVLLLAVLTEFAEEAGGGALSG